jgi:hypothetical protein
MSEGSRCRETPLRWKGVLGALHRTSLLGAELQNTQNTRSRTSSKHQCKFYNLDDLLDTHDKVIKWFTQRKEEHTRFTEFFKDYT